MEPSVYKEEYGLLELTVSSDELQARSPPSEPTDGEAFSFVFMPAKGNEILIQIPAIGYPLSRSPTISVLSAANSSAVVELEHAIQARVAEEIALGGPMLMQIYVIVSDEATRVEQEIKGKRETAAAEEEQAQQELLNDYLEHKAEAATGSKMMFTSSGIQVFRGEPHSSRKSTFLAHVARVSSVKDVSEVVGLLRSNKWIASATHPAIFAYRFKDTNGILNQDGDDDGEHGASLKMMYLLEKMGVDGYIVVVSRWFGGILLGPERFKLIAQCAKLALVQYGAVAQ